MKRAITVATLVISFAIGGAAIWAVAGGNGSTRAKEASSCDPAACATGPKTAKHAGSCDPAACAMGGKTAAVATPSGKVLGHFDLAMAGCGFACATKMKYDAKSVVAQPGVKEGKLTQCPVSGVVFRVDAMRPHVGVGADEYVTCCDACAEKLRRKPSRFVRV